MRIQHNIMAMNAYRNYTNNVSAMQKNLEKLSSGYKINRAGDDAAGLAISEKMRAQITGLETAQKNAKDGISLVQTAEGALTEVHDMLNRMVELATQSANGTYENTTDRKQLQKEVDQLLSEMNRIADSSNFNGIKLLDGTLGLNTDAFEISLDPVKAEALDPGDAIASAVTYTAKTGAASEVHFSADPTQKDPSFKISLGDVKFDVTGSNTNKAQYKVTIGTYGTVTATFAGTSAGNTKNYTTTDVASAIASKFNALNTNKGIKVGDLYFTAAADGNEIKFTYAGASVAGTYKPKATFTGAQASSFNNALGVQVKSSTTLAGSAVESGFLNHSIMDPALASAGGKVTRAGITATLSKDIFAEDGNILTIAGKDFVIMREGSATSVGSNVIDLRELVKASATASALRAEAIRQLAFKAAGDFRIESRDAANGKIHLEQTIESFASGTGTQYTYEDLTKLISAKKADTPAKNVGTTLTVKDEAKIKDGNVISVTDGSVTTKYVFGTGTDVTTGNNQVKYVATKTAAALAAAIGSLAEVNGSTITIRAAASTADAPTILGKGLTLQIGDTSDSFNQLNVAVQDMHTKSLGIDGLKIDTEEAAQQAIQKIKDAINKVSDVRGTLGATQNRLDHTINNLSVMTENIQDAESTIRDVDVAEEMMAYTKNNILIQSAQAMLAQANQVPQGVLQLLQ